MLKITIAVDLPEAQAMGVKEDVCMCLERYGVPAAVQVQSVAEQIHQMTIGPDWQHVDRSRRKR